MIGAFSAAIDNFALFCPAVTVVGNSKSALLLCFVVWNILR